MPDSFFFAPEDLRPEETQRAGEYFGGQSAYAPKPEAEVMALRKQLAGPDFENQLAGAQQKDTLMNGLGSALDTMYVANTGGKGRPLPRARSNFAENTMQQYGAKKNRLGAATDLEDNDPSSQKSAEYRAFLKSVIPGVEATPGFDGGSYAALQKLFPQIAHHQETLAKQKLDAANSAATAAHRTKQEEHATNMEQLARDRLEQDRWGTATDPITGAIWRHNKKTNELVPGSGGSGARGSTPLKPNDINDDFIALQDKLTIKNPVIADSWSRINGARRLETLIQAPNGDIENLSHEMFREATTTLAGLIGKGSVSVNQIEELTPKSMAGELARGIQFLKNEPEGVDAKAFLEKMLVTVSREKKAARLAIKEQQTQTIPGYLYLRSVDPQRFNNIVSGAGMKSDRINEQGAYGPSPLAPGEKRAYDNNSKRYMIVDESNEPIRWDDDE